MNAKVELIAPVEDPRMADVRAVLERAAREGFVEVFVIGFDTKSRTCTHLCTPRIDPLRMLGGMQMASRNLMSMVDTASHSELLQPPPPKEPT